MEYPPSPKELEARFHTVEHAFNLDGPGPRFLQDIESLEDIKPKDVSALLIDSPGDKTIRNNADLFVKRWDEAVFCRATAAIALFTLSVFAPSGGVGHRTSLRGGGPMTTLIVGNHSKFGNTLWGRLWPNVENIAQVTQRKSGTSETNSVFPWLLPTRTSEKKTGSITTPSDVHPLQVYWCMPRRVRLDFEDAAGRRCHLTGEKDVVVMTKYKTKNYGTNYSEGFVHPLTPYYRQKSGLVKLPVHPNRGGISYRLWPGLVIQSGDGLREPASVIRHWSNDRKRYAQNTLEDSRFVAFGYDMDNMKALNWVESESPLWDLGNEDTLALSEMFINCATAGAAEVAKLLVRAVKAGLFERPMDASGDVSFISERFFADTEIAFYETLSEALRSIREMPDDDPTLDVRESWMPKMADAAMRLFDELVPDEGIEDRNMQRYVKARFQLVAALHGRGKEGKKLFEHELEIAAPKTSIQNDKISRRESD